MDSPIDVVLPWERLQITLPFRVGDLCLGEVGFDAAVMTLAYTEIPLAAAQTAPLEALKRLGAKVAVIYSCPVEERPVPISLVGGALRYVPATFPRYHTDLKGSFEDYLSSQFSSKSRSTLIRKVKKVAKRAGGRPKVREYSRASEISEWHTLAQGVSEKTYQERLLKRGLPKDSDFVNGIKEQAEQGRFRGYLLFDEDEPIAYMACPITSAGVMIYDYVGHDPECNNLSPGTVLLYSVLESAFSDSSIVSFDFTEGDGIHKQRFATHETACADIWFFVPTPKNVVTFGVHASFDKIRRLLVSGLEGVGAKDALRKFIRM